MHFFKPVLTSFDTCKFDTCKFDTCKFDTCKFDTCKFDTLANNSNWSVLVTLQLKTLEAETVK